MREKLIELVKPWVAHHANAMANDLIANGVTVRQKGEWTAYEPRGNGYTDKFECSNCKSISYMDFVKQSCDFEYCPYCGADMRGAEHG